MVKGGSTWRYSNSRSNFSLKVEALRGLRSKEFFMLVLEEAKAEFYNTSERCPMRIDGNETSDLYL